jgi:hypothetical protein
MWLTVNPMNGSAFGTFQFAAANGDTVLGTVTGQAKMTSPGVLTIVETGTITGGTGRFAGATGSFTQTRIKYQATGATTASFAGAISSPGLGK